MSLCSYLALSLSLSLSLSVCVCVCVCPRVTLTLCLSQELAQQKADYTQDMEAFAAGRGPFATPPVSSGGMSPADAPPSAQQEQAAGGDGALHNPSPV